MFKMLCGIGNGLAETRFQPGDLPGLGEAIGSLTTVGAGTLTGALIAGGIINRTGPVGAFIDTPATASQILTALGIGSVSGQGGGLGDATPGATFRLMYRNTVAFAMTFQTGIEGLEYGSNLDVAASLVREYLVTLKNLTPRASISSGTTNAGFAITFDTAQPMGSVTPGMAVTGTGIGAAAVVVGVTNNGAGTLSGATVSVASTATAASGVAVLFSPVVRFDGLRSATL